MTYSFSPDAFYVAVLQAVSDQAAAQQSFFAMKDLRLLLAVAVAAAYAYALLGLLRQVMKVRKKGDLGPQQTASSMFAGLGRFACWGLIGAMLLREEPETGILFLSTRPIGALLMLVVLLHKKNPRISLKELAAPLSICSAIYLGLVILLATRELPEFLGEVLYGAIYCFFAYAAIALVGDIRSAHIHGTYRKARKYQYGMFFNFFLSFLYGLSSEVQGLSILMTVAFGLMSILQGIFCLQLILGRRAFLRKCRNRQLQHEV